MVSCYRSLDERPREQSNNAAAREDADERERRRTPNAKQQQNTLIFERKNTL